MLNKYQRVITFYGEDSVYSNMHYTPIEYKGFRFKWNEQAFQWEKAMTFGDEVIASQILAATDPFKCKSLGKKVKGFVKAEWDKKKLSVMYDLLICKYTQNPLAWRILSKTKGSRLAEASPRDLFWGTGFGKNNFLNHSPNLWRGRNAMGNLTTIVRDLMLERGWDAEVS